MTEMPRELPIQYDPEKGRCFVSIGYQKHYLQGEPRIDNHSGEVLLPTGVFAEWVRSTTSVLP
jgi:hypothetical protein